MPSWSRSIRHRATSWRHHPGARVTGQQTTGLPPRLGHQRASSDPGSTERLVSLLLTSQHHHRLPVPRNCGQCAGIRLGGPSTNPLSARRKFERDSDCAARARYRGDHRRPEEPRYRSSRRTTPFPAAPERRAGRLLPPGCIRSARRRSPATGPAGPDPLRAVSEGPTAAPAGLPVLPADLCPVTIPEELITAGSTSAAWSPRLRFGPLGFRARTVEPHHLRLAEGAWYPTP